MDFLGIGMPELVFIVLIALIIIGPKDMEKTGRAIGRFLNNFVRSDSWRAFRQTSKEVRNLPNRLMREANLEELERLTKEPLNLNRTSSAGKQIKKVEESGYGTWDNPGAQMSRSIPTSADTENSIAPPQTETDTTPVDDKNE